MTIVFVSLSEFLSMSGLSGHEKSTMISETGSDALESLNASGFDSFSHS